MREPSALLPCPFCQEAVQFRKALHISDGNVDSIIHAAPTNCPMVVFEDGSIDESILFKWNTRAPPAQGEPVVTPADLAEVLENVRASIAKLGNRRDGHIPIELHKACQALAHMTKDSA